VKIATDPFNCIKVWDFLNSCITVSFTWSKLVRGVVQLVFVGSLSLANSGLLSL
jgi:hypothetical protein